MVDQPVAQVNPFLLRKEEHQVLFDFHRIFFGTQPQSVAEPFDVGIDHHSGASTHRRAENAIGRFPPDARQLDQPFHFIGHLALMFGRENAATLADILRFVPIKPGALDHFFQIVKRSFGEILGRGIFFEQRGGHLIDADVGALGREDRRDEQLQRGIIRQAASGVGIAFFQAAQHFSSIGLLVRRDSRALA